MASKNKKQFYESMYNDLSSTTEGDDESPVLPKLQARKQSVNEAPGESARRNRSSSRTTIGESETTGTSTRRSEQIPKTQRTAARVPNKSPALLKRASTAPGISEKKPAPLKRASTTAGRPKDKKKKRSPSLEPVARELRIFDGLHFRS